MDQTTSCCAIPVHSNAHGPHIKITRIPVLILGRYYYRYVCLLILVPFWPLLLRFPSWPLVCPLCAAAAEQKEKCAAYGFAGRSQMIAASGVLICLRINAALNSTASPFPSQLWMVGIKRDAPTNTDTSSGQREVQASQNSTLVEDDMVLPSLKRAAKQSRAREKMEIEGKATKRRILSPFGPRDFF
ncbi:hypothetical protein F4778DRAFT_114106 [Xylariomycetidae sp. FL2044]|nr:hypothetical protein F4778DRAFT_114106 [Xylariomycetidae sp. FL2044]